MNQANRFRKDYEFINYWKVEEEIKKRFAEADVTEHIVENVHYTQLSLLDKIDKLKEDIDILIDDPRLKDETQRADTAEEQLKTLRHELGINKIIYNAAQTKLDAALVGGELALSGTLLYGTHVITCNYLEFLESGRVAGNLAKEALCDCKWNDIKKDTEEALKIILENHNSNT